MSCINPPVPPNSTHLKHLYTAVDVIDRYGNVTYSCEDGYFFETDYFKVGFNVTCVELGLWEHPIPWPVYLDPEGIAVYQNK